ncbi:hypothetical protein [Chryseobacterium chendengshani]|uniref:hypothetical protein n=1 Tax=Chryseobacterium sp. LJ756 TaxID=2864113 RepID=UPI001C64270F|nr:hypothetical protein [Chryseobacterium sp. LJ756]MBW7676459.1 hypothetical protein [Chryseobacterium sp. LJ756]
MRNLLLPFLLILSFIFSCRSESDGLLEEKFNSYDVYVAGIENNEACYWKNNIKTVLTGGSGITPYKIIVENNDVYVLAASNAAPQNYYIWKNNVKINVDQYIGMNSNTGTISQYGHSIQDFQVDQGNIYLFGIVSSPVVQLPNGVNYYTIELCYWKNGIKTVLFTRTPDFNQPHVTYRNFIVSNGNVYVPINKFLNKITDSPYELGYFKNNTYHTIASYSDYKSFNHISKGTNNSIYISINDNINNNTYYKNITTNTDSYLSQTNKTKFNIDGNDLYEFSNVQNYLKNDVPVSSAYALDFKHVDDLAALNQNVYQIRSKWTNDAAVSYKVYINNTETQQINATNGVFKSIFVDPN